MKKKITILILLFALILLSVFLFVFGYNYGTRGSKSYTSAAPGIAYSTAALQETSASFNEMSDRYDRLREEEAVSEAANLNNTERKLIKRASIRIRVENLDTADASIAELMKGYGAYSASTEANENSRHYSLRVPAHLYDTFLAEMNGIGRLLYRSESTEDVTLRYYDLEGRLATKRELLKTFQSYLGRANNIEEILSVEARIAELQYDIEGTGIQLRNLANRVDYATIDLSLLGPVMATSNQNATFGEQIRELFGNLGSFFSTLTVVVVGIVIFGIPILLILALLFWLLLGKIGLLKKLWKLVAVKKQES
jgi:hypothetical protein